MRSCQAPPPPSWKFGRGLHTMLQQWLTQMLLNWDTSHGILYFFNVWNSLKVLEYLWAGYKFLTIFCLNVALVVLTYMHCLPSECWWPSQYWFSFYEIGLDYNTILVPVNDLVMLKNWLGFKKLPFKKHSVLLEIFFR